MKVYVAIFNDTHSDPEPHVFVDREYAVNYAREWAQLQASDPEDYEEQEINGWLFYARYSPESSVWVIERELHGSPRPTSWEDVARDFDKFRHTNSI